MYSSYYGHSYHSYNGWMFFSIIVAIIGGIALYFTFLHKKNEGQFTGFKGWLYDFLTFKKLVIENILRVGYVIFAVFFTISSFCFLTNNVLVFLGWLVLGNLITRLIYEFSLIMLIMCRNTTEINQKLTSYKVEK